MDPTRTAWLTLPGGAQVGIGVVEHVFPAWPGPRPTNRFGAKPLVASAGRGVFAEVAIVDLLVRQGWEAVWASTYGGLRFFADQPDPTSSNNVALPGHVEHSLARITEVNVTHAGLFDVIAWRGEQLRFVEAKRRGRDRIRDTQLRWVASALASGLQPTQFSVLEWTLQ